MYELRELSRDDLKEINEWRNDPELIALLGAPFRFIDIEVDRKWLDNYMTSRNSTVRCAVVEHEKLDKILGLVSLTSIDHIHRSAELHIMIGREEYRGKGIGTFAVRQMLTHAFDNVNLRRVELSVLENNERARHLYEKCGFVLEGVKREAVYKNGKYLNMCMYSVLREEFKEIT